MRLGNFGFRLSLLLISLNIRRRSSVINTPIFNSNIGSPLNLKWRACSNYRQYMVDIVDSILGSIWVERPLSVAVDWNAHPGMMSLLVGDREMMVMLRASFQIRLVLFAHAPQIKRLSISKWIYRYEISGNQYTLCLHCSCRSFKNETNVNQVCTSTWCLSFGVHDNYSKCVSEISIGDWGSSPSCRHTLHYRGSGNLWQLMENVQVDYNGVLRVAADL
jgi:hypothetical protein